MEIPPAYPSLFQSTITILPTIRHTSSSNNISVIITIPLIMSQIIIRILTKQILMEIRLALQLILIISLMKLTQDMLLLPTPIHLHILLLQILI